MILKKTYKDKTEEEEELCDKKNAHAVPLASARQRPENQKENPAGHSAERTVEGQEGPTRPGFTVHSPRAEGLGQVKVSSTLHLVPCAQKRQKPVKPV